MEGDVVFSQDFSKRKDGQQEKDWIQYKALGDPTGERGRGGEEISQLDREILVGQVGLEEVQVLLM